MELLKWPLLLILAFASGACFVLYLTVHPLQMSRYLFLTCLSLFATVTLLAVGWQGIALVAAVVAALLAALVGYWAITQRVLAREDPRQLPTLTRAPGDRGDGHTAVIYFAHGEPETYNPIGWINQFREFDAQGIPFVPLLARPFFLYKLRNKYLLVGKSDHRQKHGQMLRRLEEAYRARGDHTTRFYLSFLDDDPRPDAAVIQALNEGASRIIVAEVFLTVSNHTAEGKELIEALDVARYGVELRYTGPLWDSETLKRMFVERANRALDGVDKARVGILLVGHGQPDAWDREWPTETEHETRFRQDVLRLLAADGFAPHHVSLAWMEFKEPKPAPKIEEFVRDGVERVLYFSAAISADGIHSQYDVPELVGRARVPPGFPLINLGAWNDDPLVIRAIQEKIDAQLEGQP